MVRFTKKLPNRLKIKKKHQLTPRMRLEKIPALFSRHLTGLLLFDNIVIFPEGGEFVEGWYKNWMVFFQGLKSHLFLLLSVPTTVP